MSRESGNFRRWRRWIFLVVLLSGLLVLYDQWRVWRENSQDGVILAAAARYGVEPALVKAVVWRESWFDPWARGRAGEIGLMQVGESAAREWAEAERIQLFVHSQLFDPAKNTQAGTWYLSKLLQHYAATDNPLPYALAAYNAGQANVLKWAQGVAVTNSSLFIERIGFPSTKSYVRAVIKRFGHYRPVFPLPTRMENK
jgi:soluble lytic murein transglycosylase